MKNQDKIMEKELREFQDNCREILYSKFNEIIENLSKNHPESFNGKSTTIEVRAETFTDDKEILDITDRIPKEMWPFCDITSILFEYYLDQRLQVEEVHAPLGSCFDAGVLYGFHLFLRDNIGLEGIKGL